MDLREEGEPTVRSPAGVGVRGQVGLGRPRILSSGICLWRHIWRPRQSVTFIVDMPRWTMGQASLNLECELVISSTRFLLDGVTWSTQGRNMGFTVNHVSELLLVVVNKDWPGSPVFVLGTRIVVFRRLQKNRLVLSGTLFGSMFVLCPDWSSLVSDAPASLCACSRDHLKLHWVFHE